MTLICDTGKYYNLNFTGPANFHSPEVVDHGGETKLKSD